jgi:hypothetical protein
MSEISASRINTGQSLHWRFVYLEGQNSVSCLVHENYIRIYVYNKEVFRGTGQMDDKSVVVTCQMDSAKYTVEVTTGNQEEFPVKLLEGVVPAKFNFCNIYLKPAGTQSFYMYIQSKQIRRTAF